MAARPTSPHDRGGGRRGAAGRHLGVEPAVRRGHLERVAAGDLDLQVDPGDRRPTDGLHGDLVRVGHGVGVPPPPDASGTLTARARVATPPASSVARTSMAYASGFASAGTFTSRSMLCAAESST